MVLGPVPVVGPVACCRRRQNHWVVGRGERGAEAVIRLHYQQSSTSPWSKKRYLLRYLEGVEASHTVSLCHCVTVWQLAINVIVPFFLLGLRHRPLDDKRYSTTGSLR